MADYPDSALAYRFLHYQFASVKISEEAETMVQAGDNAGIMDIKKNLRHLYEMVAIGVMDNKEMAKEIKSMGETVSYTSVVKFLW